MTIGINARFLQKRFMEGYGNYILHTTLQLASQLPQHKYILFFDQPYDLDIHFPNNCTLISIGPKARLPLQWHYWYNVSLPLAVKKNKVELLLSFDGFCSLTTNVPQFLCIHDLAFHHFPQGITKAHLWYYKYYTPKFIKKAHQIFTVSHFSKNDIEEKYPFAKNKVAILYNGVKPIFQPLDWPAQNKVREKYTDDAMYFIYVGSIHPRKNLINLLKAFSIFKKWQKSNMKLVLAGRMAWKNDAFKKQLNTYKHKADVILVDQPTDEDLANLMGAAYALVYPSLFEGFGVPIVEAMQCQVPVITTRGSGMHEAGSDAAYYANPNDIQEIANQMQLVYKNEELRAEVIEKANIHVEKFNWQKTVQPLLKAIDSFEKK